MRIFIHDKKDGFMTTLGFQWNRKTLWSYRMRCRRHLDPGSGDITVCSLQWRHNGRDCVSYHQPHQCLRNRIFRRRSKKTSKPCVTGLWAGNSPVTGEFPAQRACSAENVSIWWRHHVIFTWHHSYSMPYLYSCNTCIICMWMFRRPVGLPKNGQNFADILIFFFLKRKYLHFG